LLASVGSGHVVSLLTTDMVELMLDEAIELTRVVVGCPVVEVAGVDVGADMGSGSGTITRRLPTLSVALDQLVTIFSVVWDVNGMKLRRGCFPPLLCYDVGDHSINDRV
jgi:hypothetical protein